ncbi:MAG: LamG domain-containing protein [Saccharofermentanales bacterium]
MKKLLSYLFTLILILSLFAGIPNAPVLAVGTNYYIDTAGNNGSAGTSPETAWADFTNVSSRNLNSGDQILLKRGCTWTASQSGWYFCAINGSGVTVDAYGTGANPVMDGNGLVGCGFYYLNRDNLAFKNISFIDLSVTTFDSSFTTYNHSGLTFKNLSLTNSYILITSTMPDADDGNTFVSDILIDNIVSNNADNVSSISIGTPLESDTGLNNSSDQSVTDVIIHNVNIQNTDDCAIVLNNCSNVTLSSVYVYNDCVDYAPQGTTALFLYKTGNLKFNNCILANTPNSGSYDQCAVDNEAYNDQSIFRGCYVGGNAGAGLEYLHLANRPGDYNTNHQVDSCTFQNNAAAGSGTYKSSMLDSSATGVYSSGTASNNLYRESTGFTTGNFNSWTMSNNTSISSDDNLSNAGWYFTNTQGGYNWSYQTYNGSVWSNMTFSGSGWYYGTTSNFIGHFDTLPDATSTHKTARAYTAPYTGTISIRGWAQLPYNNMGGDGVRVRITQNGTSIWGTSTISGTDTAGISTNVSSITVNAGDIIRFEVDCGSSNSNSYDDVSWIPSVAYTAVIKPSSEWKLDGNSYDSAGANNGTPNGGYSYVAGKRNDAISLNGSTGYVNVPDSVSLDSMSKLTISVWLKMTSLPAAGQTYDIVSKEGASTGAYRICVGSNGTGHIIVATANNSWYSSGTTAAWTTQMQAGTWYHIVGTYDGSYVRMYINGSLQGTGAQAISGNVVRSANPFRIGYTSSLNYFNGVIDDVKVFTDSLNSTQITSLYNSYSNSLYTLPDHEWKFNINAKDYIGNKDASISGGYTWVAGKQDFAVSLNGTSGYVNVADNDILDNMSKLTLSVWIKLSSLPSANKYYDIISKEDGSTGSFRILLASDGTGHIELPTTNNGWYSSGTTAGWTTPMTTGTWYHIVATYDGSYVRMYINGSLTGTGAQAISGNLISTSHALRFGYAPAAIFEYFNGIIDDVRMYDGALDSTGVSNLYGSY